MGVETNNPVLAAISALKLLPVLVIEDAGDAETLGDALIAGGLPLVEVTLRTPAALQAVRELAIISDMTVGVGSVIRPSQVEEALSAGAQFIVCPGFNSDVVREAKRTGILVIPGVATASELMGALGEDLTTVKFFPAEQAGGRPTIEALSGPFPDARFLPTGGVNESNYLHYLRLRNVIGVGGSWMTPPSAVALRRGDLITERVVAARRAIKELEL